MLQRALPTILSVVPLAVSPGKQSGSGGDGYSRGPRQMYPVTCGQCGAQTQVPFQPRGDKPVYCRDCYIPALG